MSVGQWPVTYFHARTEGAPLSRGYSGEQAPRGAGSTAGHVWDCGSAVETAIVGPKDGEVGREVIGVFVRARTALHGMEGAQHAGTVSGFGGTKGSSERGSMRWLADFSSEAVVKVIANATAKRSCRALCGWGLEEEHLANRSINSSKAGWM